MTSKPKARRHTTRRGVPWLLVGVLLGVASGLTVWSAVLGDASVGLVVGISTGLLLGVALLDIAPPAA